MEIRKKEASPLKLRNTSRLGVRPISISVPDELLLKINSIVGDGERSSWICRILKQHLTKIEEDDPRYRLKQKRAEQDERSRLRQNQLREATKKVRTLKKLIEYEDKEYKDEITQLEEEARNKMIELMENG